LTSFLPRASPTEEGRVEAEEHLGRLGDRQRVVGHDRSHPEHCAEVAHVLAPLAGAFDVADDGLR
jgi:hypothetical protein